jgi:ATP-dependent Lhr-like helicase
VFFAEIARVVGGFPGDVSRTLWEMVWAGEVTNDTLAPLRSLLRPEGARGKKARLSARRPSSLGTPGTEGRWSLRASRWADRPSETERRAALARSLLARYGVVTREAVQAEGVALGFGAVYGVLKAMEQAGRVRRGYFVTGHGATQFALPGADDRLRAVREPSETPATRLLAATDPANAYGASIAWPARPGTTGAEPREGARPQRMAGAYVVLHDGVLLGWLGRSGQTLLTFGLEAPGAADALANALVGLVETGARRVLLLLTIDDAPAGESSHVHAFLQAGFSAGTRGLERRRSEASFLAKTGVLAR